MEDTHDKERKVRIKEEIERNLKRMSGMSLRDHFCSQKAAALHRNLPLLSQIFVSKKSLESALIQDWISKEKQLLAFPHLALISDEDLILYLLRNPRLLHEPEVMFMHEMLKLGDRVADFKQECPKPHQE